MVKNLTMRKLEVIAAEVLLHEVEARKSRDQLFDALFEQLPKTDVLLSKNSKAIGFTTPYDLIYNEYIKISNDGPADINVGQGNGSIVIEYKYKNEDYSSIAITDNSVSVKRYDGENAKQVITLVKEYREGKWMANIVEYENRETFNDDYQHGYQKIKQKK